MGGSAAGALSSIGGLLSPVVVAQRNSLQGFKPFLNAA